MKTKTNNRNCKSIRQRILKAVNNCIGLNAGWIQNHIADCPKCRQRLASVGKVHLAFSLVKSQPHNLDLLMHANKQAIGVLKHSLRNCQKAEKLKTMLPEPTLFEKYRKYNNSIVNTAACIFILFLMKTGIFCSMDKVESKSQKVLEQYYTKQLGQEMSNEIFTAS